MENRGSSVKHCLQYTYNNNQEHITVRATCTDLFQKGKRELEAKWGLVWKFSRVWRETGESHRRWMWSSTLYSCRKFSKTGKQEQGKQISYLHKYHHTMSLRVECDGHYEKQMPLSRTLVVCNLSGHNGSRSAGMSSSTAIYICVCICA